MHRDPDWRYEYEMTCVFLFLALLFGAFNAPAVLACTDQTACTLDGRTYHVREPDTWDGESALPVLLHFHGWGRDGALIVRHNRISTLAVADDVLVLAPTGRGGTWDFRREGSRDSVFARAVIEDAAARYPIDPDRIYVSGYSFGSYMAWRFVCDDGADIAALLAVAGSFPPDAPCAQAPRSVRQVYGLGDQVLDFPYGPNGETDTPIALWRTRFGCAPEDAGTSFGAWNARDFLTFERREWSCAGGDIILDLHPGGHFIPHDWIPLQVEELLSQNDR